MAYILENALYWDDQQQKSSLVSKNITVLGRRTSVRLEPEMWTAMFDIAKRERCSIHDLCSLIQIRKRPLTSLTAAIRVFLMLYFKASSNEEGHQRAGHGSFENMKRRARVSGNLKDWRHMAEGPQAVFMPGNENWQSGAGQNRVN